MESEGLINDLKKQIEDLTTKMETAFDAESITNYGIEIQKLKVQLGTLTELPTFGDVNGEMGITPIEPKTLDVANSGLTDYIENINNATLANKNLTESMPPLNEELISFSQIMGDVVSSAIMLAADALVDMVEGKNILDAFADFIKGMGRMMAQYGAMLMAQGVAQKAFEGAGGATGKIIAGAAMLALGLAVSAGGAAINKAGASGSAASSMGGSYSGGGYYSGYGGDNGGTNEIVLKARGADLVAVIDEQTIMNRANG